MIEYKTINGFEDYIISSDGRVYNKTTNTLRAPTSNKSGKGYLYVDLYNRGKHKRFYIHRLVAFAFIPNKENKPYINHKDGNPKNNNVDNLEWCTPLENVEHASKVIKTMKQYEVANKRRRKGVIMIDKSDLSIVATFNSINEASYYAHIPSSNIIACLKGRQSYTKEYIWQYVEEVEE